MHRRHCITASLCVALGMMVSLYLPPIQPQTAEPVDAFCLERQRGVLAASVCSSKPSYTSDPVMRKLLGSPACWWTMSRKAFTEIRGVGSGTSGAIARYRDLGGPADIVGLQQISGIGEATAQLIVESVTTNCPRSRMGGVR